MIDSDKEQYFKTKAFKVLFDKYEKSTYQREPFYFDPEELTDIAEYYLYCDDNDKAISIIDKAIQTFPDAIDPLLFRSRYALLYEDNIEKAKLYAKQIKDTSDYEFIYLKAEILIHEEKSHQADKYLQKELRCIDSQEKLDYIYDVAQLFLEYEILDLAKKWINYYDDKAAKDYLETAARIHVLEQDYTTAEELYSQLTLKEPFSTYFWIQLTAAQYLNGKFQQALQSSEFALAIDPHCEDALITKANCLLSLEKLPESLKFFQRYLQQHPKDGHIEAIVASIYIRMEMPEKALEYYDNAIKDTTDDPYLNTDVIKEKALLLISLDKQEEAFQFIDEHISRSQSNIENLYIIKGQLLMVCKQKEKSIQQFEQAISVSTNKTLTYYFIGESCYNIKVYDLAYSYFRHITIELEDNEAIVGWGYYAACCTQLGYTKEFLHALKKGCEVNTDEIYIAFSDILSPNVLPKDLYKFITNKLIK